MVSMFIAVLSQNNKVLNQITDALCLISNAFICKKKIKKSWRFVDQWQKRI